MEDLAVLFIEMATQKRIAIIEEMQKASKSKDHFEKPLVEDAIMGAVLTGAKMAVEELAKKDKLK